ncbi:Pol polyprotein [Plakobranchus ocellatus]|uniref:Pol polyprotein n=1 Tax=Plakobranchus ocellatus TaxID=259542 RepID=A0AAV3ZCB2_9GAST|nr:Pol polyprotein [Plakobranchus ocellatus]
MEIIHRPWKQHGNADALSRIPHVEECSSYTASGLLTALTCGGCKYCQRMQRSWGEFTEEVDDVVPLSGAVRSLAQQRPMGHIAEEQRKDKDISLMMNWLQGEEPDEDILALASPPLKHMWMNRQLFSITEDTLYRADPEDRG